MTYTPSGKISIIKEVIDGKQSVYSVCKKYNLSKMTFYKWLSIYKRARKNRHVSLESNIKEGSDHYKSLSSSNKYKVLTEVHKNPELSCHQVANVTNLGNHAVQNLLEKEGLSRLDQRVEYSKKPFWKRETAERRQGMMELYEQGWMIDSICRHYKISKTTFFKWRQRYLEAKELGKLLALGDRYVSGNVHHKYIDESVKDKVVEIVAQNPDWSVHRIAASVAKSEGKPVIGHHAIQDLLLKRDLNTIDKRRLYAQGYVRQLAPAIQIYDTPVPSLSVWRLLFAPFKTVPKWVIKHPASWPIVFPVTIFLAWIIEVDKLFNPAFFFPTVALTFGMFFFLYSLKYYFSLIMVMKVAQGGEGVNNPDVDVDLERGPQSFAMRIKNIIGKSIKISQPISKVNPLALNFSKVELASRPFVSIHAPIYNEKRVVERLIKACSSQNWVDDVSQKANFEVVIIDDSTDDTTEIVKQFLRDNYGELRLIRDDKGTEIYRVDAVPHLPSITLIHRASRSGYKGAALGNAMSYIDQRAEYVCVFDADFVPYPDTIEQFMKSFQEACGGLEKVAESKIAAVQGYQWHVLNKSENWVTRGVRTEYAGSYVVERAGIGIYGGLNQIAGSVFCIRVDVLKAFGWRTSITEDLQLTLRLYEQGFKVVFNPYIQAPAEAVSTVKRLIRQRMRWAEGHTFNVKQMWQKMMYSQRISGREKFEFMYLAPYYLQAAFFLIGVTAWFISEVVIHTRLPFWTAAWGWSLVFTNFLALPLMNLAGLFLEESEEKDYVGVASFMLLSYIVVPFQAYAAVKALFETEEGPWFRTPKTGLITDNFDRGRFYGWLEKLKLLGGAGAGVSGSQLTVHGGFGERFNFARVTAHNPLQGYRIMPRRAPRISRGVIALLLAVVVILNYAAFFVPTANADFSSTPALEQQINIIDQVTTAPGTSTGIVCVDTTRYDGTVLYYFEVVEKLNATGTGGATLTYAAGTCSSGGTPATPSGGSTQAISTSMTTSYVRYRSASFSLTSGMAYVSAVSGSGATIDAARIIVTQTHATKLTKTETQVEVGSSDTSVQTTPTFTGGRKYYCFDSTQTGTTCTTGASPSRFSPTPTVYFEATLKSSNASGTATASLSSNACGSEVLSSPVSVTGTTWKHVRSSSITLTAGSEHLICLYTNNAAYTASVANAKIVLVQSAASGIVAVETTQLYLNTPVSTMSTTYVGQNYDNSYTDTNFSGTVTLYHEADLSVSLTKGSSGSANADIINTATTQYGAVSTNKQLTNNRVRSTSITPASFPASVYDSELKCALCDGSTEIAGSTKSWLIIQTQSMPVPEIALVALPGMFFLPKIVAWWRRREQGKVKRGKFGKINKGKFIRRFKTPFGLLARKSIIVRFKHGGIG